MKQEEKKKLPYDFESIYPSIHPPAILKLLIKWKKERGYCPIKNPEARHHINNPVLRELRKKKK